MLSVVTISLNQVRFLRQLHHAVNLLRHELDVEWIVVDGASTDGSLDLLRESSQGPDELVVGQDTGPADALNIGLGRVSMPTMVSVNADDLILPHKVGAVLQRMAQARVDIAVANALVIDDNGTVVGTRHGTPLSVPFLARGVSTIVHPATFVRTAAAQQVQFNEQNRTCWDAEWLLDLLVAGATSCWIPTYSAAFRLHEGSISGSGRMDRQYLADVARLRSRAAMVSRRRVRSPLSAKPLTRAIRFPVRTGMRLRAATSGFQKSKTQWMRSRGLR